VSCFLRTSSLEAGPRYVGTRLDIQMIPAAASRR
jgi:hypothetical protein